MTTKTIKTDKLFRHLVLDRAAGGVDVEKRTVELAFSSEAPVRRWFGTEVLDHAPESCDLSRLNNFHPLLDNHDPDEQIGVVLNARIDSDKVGRCTVQFSRAAEAEEIFQDVIDGIRRHVSVGYIVSKYNEETTVEKDGSETTIARVVSWTPLEVSLVSIPADPTVGVGRSAGAEQVDTQVVSADKPAPEAPKPAPIEVQVKRNHTMEITERKAGADAEQKRTTDLLALADIYEKFGAREMVADFIRTGKSAEQFTEALLTKIVSRHSDARALEIGMNDQERQSYNVSRAIIASISGDWSKAGLERAASEAVAKRTGLTPEGFFIPVEAFGKRAFTAGTAAEAGNLIQTSVLGNEFIDVLRNAMVLNKMGARFLGGLSGNIAIPRKSSASTIASLTEIQAIVASNPATAQISMTPKRVGGQVLYSKQALIQSSLDVENMLRDDLAQTAATQIENLAFNGTAAAGQPRGLVNGVGIGSVVGGADGLAINWGHIVDLESACANANSEPDQRAGYVVNTKSRGKMKKTQKAANIEFIWDRDQSFPLNGYRAGVTNHLPSNGTKGLSAGITSTLLFGSDWSDLVIGLFGGLDIVVDPYTQAGTGQLVITANQFIDVAIRQAASFAAMTDALTT